MNCTTLLQLERLGEAGVVRIGDGRADAVSAWLTAAMKDGMAELIAPVPVEVQVGRTWAGDVRPE